MKIIKFLSNLNCHDPTFYLPSWLPPSPCLKVRLNDKFESAIEAMRVSVAEAKDTVRAEQIWAADQVAYHHRHPATPPPRHLTIPPPHHPTTLPPGRGGDPAAVRASGAPHCGGGARRRGRGALIRRRHLERDPGGAGSNLGVVKVRNGTLMHNPHAQPSCTTLMHAQASTSPRRHFAAVS